MFKFCWHKWGRWGRAIQDYNGNLHQVNDAIEEKK